jgi:hypothetical protein
LSLVIDLLRQTLSQQSSNVAVSEQTYLKWREDFLFETLQYGTRYGQSFCNKFDITDYILYYMRDMEQADRHIRKNYVR